MAINPLAPPVLLGQAPPPMPGSSLVSAYAPPDPTATTQMELARKIAQQQAAQAEAAHKAALAQAENAGQGYNQLATAGEGVPAQITEMFDAAAGKSEAFAQGFSQAFQSETEKLQQQQQELLRKQTGDPNAAVPGNKLLGDASMFLGGLPASVYRTQGAGLSAAAALQPGLIRSQGLQAVQTAKQAETDAYAKLLSDLQEKSNMSLLSAQKTDVANAFAREKAETSNAAAERRATETARHNKILEGQGKTRVELAGEAAVERKRIAEEKRSGYQVQLNPDGSFTYRTDEKGDPLLTEAAQSKALSRAISQTSQDLRRLGLQQSALSAAQRNSLYFMTLDKDGVPQVYIDPDTKKPVLTAAGVKYQNTLNQQDIRAGQIDWSNAMQQATLYASQFGTVAVPVLKNGRWVAEMQFTKNGKPILTVSGRSAQAALTSALKKDKAESLKIMAMAVAGAKAAARGWDEAKSLTPLYEVVEIDTNTGMPKTVPKGGSYSFTLKDSSGNVTGFGNHHGPSSYEEAIQTAITSGIPVATADKVLRDAGVFPTITTEEAQKGLMGTGGLAPFPGSNPNTPPKGGRKLQTRIEVPADASPFAKNLLSEATQFLGTPYSWGGGGPGGPSYGIEQGAKIKGFDCSSFAQYLYAKAGISIPRTTYEQWKVGTPVGKSELQPGDLVFFRPGSRGPEHEGIYVGNDQFLEAPYTGQVVRVSNMSKRDDFMGGRRING